MIRFPEGFTWGAATSSYQIEGGWLEGGRGLSIWDAFTHTPGRIDGGATGDIACDHFHRWREDVGLMAQLGIKAYRFSIAWPRIQPAGRGPANEAGIRFYSELIDALLDHGIEPWVTLYHWDLPLALQLELDGWLNPVLADLFREYAGLCFDRFGDRVKHWITLNEPWVAAVLGYGQGLFAPGRRSDAEPYLAAHHMLRAHGLAAELYHSRYAHQQGRIGLAPNCDWREPLTPSPEDREAAQRAIEFILGWFGDPLYFGAYPESMQARLQDRLPNLSAGDRALLKGSSDFFGINHYTTHQTAAAAGAPGASAAWSPEQDMEAAFTFDPDWERTGMGWAIVPVGLNRLLHWIDQRYGRPEIVITENGCAIEEQLIDGAVKDSARIAYFQSYLAECHRAIAAGVRLTGYFAWSLMDNLEWTSGYGKRFGLHYVDFASRERIPKASAAWFRRVVQQNGF
ncbi:MAG TPA: GH1 family beta-glucosidase [bacterium]|nr:GH1 family beta-glucosidase [bacterium]HQG44681.1 GH1 family beta-glucosidase [bacterium]HQI50120.1 GH1 family beta-glucosidase [bacterium]HQJ65211.1 GH1 family beta-glucosidase [bacterium]